MRRLGLCVAVLTAWVWGNGALTAAAQTSIFNASPTGQPGETINLQGHFSATVKVYLAQATAGTAITPSILVQSAGQATVAIPNNWPLDVYKLWVEDSTSHSPAFYINRARGIHYDSPEVIAGGTVRIFGRNLKFAQGTCGVRFVQHDSGASTDATIEESESEEYKIRVHIPPSLLAGRTYDVYITNGLGAY